MSQKVVGLLLAACMSMPAQAEEGTYSIEELLGQASVQGLRSGRSLTAFRIRSPPRKDPRLLDGGPGIPAASLFHNYEILERRDNVDPLLARQIAAALLELGHYAPNIGPLCFAPGIGLRFEGGPSGSSPTDILVCFDCTQVRLFTGDEVTGGTIDLGFNPLLLAVQPLFPDDQQLAELQPHASTVSTVLKAWEEPKNILYFVDWQPDENSPPAPRAKDTHWRRMPEATFRALGGLLARTPDERTLACPSSYDNERHRAIGTRLHVFFGSPAAETRMTFDFNQNIVASQHGETRWGIPQGRACFAKVREEMLKVLRAGLPKDRSIKTLGTWYWRH